MSNTSQRHRVREKVRLHLNPTKRMFMRNGWVSDTIHVWQSEYFRVLQLGVAESRSKRRTALSRYEETSGLGNLEELLRLDKDEGERRLRALLFDSTVLSALKNALDIWVLRNQDEYAISVVQRETERTNFRVKLLITSVRKPVEFRVQSTQGRRRGRKAQVDENKLDWSHTLRYVSPALYGQQPSPGGYVTSKRCQKNIQTSTNESVGLLSESLQRKFNDPRDLRAGRTLWTTSNSSFTCPLIRSWNTRKTCNFTAVYMLADINFNHGLLPTNRCVAVTMCLHSLLHSQS